MDKQTNCVKKRRNEEWKGDKERRKEERKEGIKQGRQGAK